jgi:8-oxo-dGTP diphosphatase
MQNPISDLFGNRLRVRACGICIQDEKILLVNHKFLTAGDFWAPPGGGVSVGEKAEACVAREFKEETDLTVTVGKFLFACELIAAPLHAIELFFEVFVQSGNMKKGIDPEMDLKDQIIQNLKFVSESEIKTMKANTLHGLFQMTTKPSEILRLNGYFKL